MQAHLAQLQMAAEVLYAMVGRDREVRAALAAAGGLADLVALTHVSWDALLRFFVQAGGCSSACLGVWSPDHHASRMFERLSASRRSESAHGTVLYGLIRSCCSNPSAHPPELQWRCGRRSCAVPGCLLPGLRSPHDRRSRSCSSCGSSGSRGCQLRWPCGCSYSTWPGDALHQRPGRGLILSFTLHAHAWALAR